MSQIVYRSNIKITVEDFIDLLKRSTLAERRPVDDRARIKKMLDHANVVVTAWSADLLVGVSRAVTDFSFCCYLSDLAVDENYPHQGIGKQLVKLTHETAGLETQLILLAAPKATNYYPKIGMKQFAHCFVFDRRT
jgi:N-acetylglutamate synthase-like GNAT family acetyltransferase